MKRAVARGRIVPQSLSTDPRLGQLSLKAALLFPLIWINCDDQGRISGNPNEIKYVTCPNIEHITKTDIPELLDELEEQGLIKVYATSKTKAIQMLDWWEEQKLQWAYPSHYPAPEGWTDHLRYHPTPKEIRTENWPPPSQEISKLLPSALPSKLPSALPKELPSKLSQREKEPKREIETEKERGRGKRKLPSALGSKATTATTATETATDTAPDSETLEGVGKAKATETAELELESFQETLEGWRFGRADDLAWLREFCQDWPDFNLSLAKACRDWHSGKPPPKHKGIWKNRFREWIEHKRKFEKEKGGKASEQQRRGLRPKPKPGKVPTEEELEAQEKERGLR